MSTNRFVVAHFETYQKARVEFVSGLAELAQHPQNIDTIREHGGIGLCRSLLIDNVPSIQHSAALALGRIANHSSDMAELIVANDVLPQLVHSLAEQNRFYKRSACFVLRSIARHTPKLAQDVVDAGSLDPLVACLEDFDPQVKEAAAWALGFIAKHAPDLAQAVADSGAIPPLVLCTREPELSLKRIAVASLADISKHTPELAQMVVDTGAISYIAPLLASNDAKLRRQVCSFLSQTAKHTVELAEMIVQADVFPRALLLIRDSDVQVRRNAATLVREVVKHSPELAQFIANKGGITTLIEFIAENDSDVRLPGVMALGYMAAFSEALALTIINAKGVPPLIECISDVSGKVEQHCLAAAAWAIGQVGRHSTEHSGAVCEANALPRLLSLYIADGSTADLREKAKRSIKVLVCKCELLPALDVLLHQAPSAILKYVVEQYARILPQSVDARRQFASSGGLKRIQQIEAEPGSKLCEAINQCNACYPNELVSYYTKRPEDMLNMIK